MTTMFEDQITAVETALDEAIKNLREAERLSSEYRGATTFLDDAIGFALNGALTAKDRLDKVGDHDIEPDTSLAGQLQDAEMMARDMGLADAADAIKNLARGS